MAIAYLHLVGSWEDLDETIRYQIQTNWNPANTNSITPTFKSATGTNVDHSWPRATSFGTNQIHFNEEEIGDIPSEQANGDFWQGMLSLVYIDVFAADANKLKSFVREINRIIWTINPNSSVRVKKSNATEDSVIDRFDPPTVKFIKERNLNPPIKIMPHTSGTLRIIWYKTKQ